MKIIPLTQEKVALIDDGDFEQVNKLKWRIQKAGKCTYVAHSTWDKKLKRKGMIFLHRFILNTPKNMMTDHINGNGLDNRRCNLRICTALENSRYRPNHNVGTSKYQGVHWHKNKRRWQALIWVDNKSVYLGNYKEEIKAALAYNVAAKKYFGEFATINFI